MDILGRARKLESRIARTVDRVAQQWAHSGGREPLEVFQMIVEAVAAHLEPAGRGRHVFPFNRIEIAVVAPTREARARFAAVLDGDPSLQDGIAARLRAAGCDPAGVHVRTSFVEEADAGWPRREFHIAFDRRVALEPPPSPHPVLPTLVLTAVAGAAAEPARTFAVPHLAIGRGVEVRDSRHRLLRTNHFAFSEGDDPIGQTVSRRHAHIDYVPGARAYRLADDASAHGTSIVRHGRTIPVPSGSRGIRLQSGDEIVLGEARLLVTIESD